MEKQRKKQIDEHWEDLVGNAFDFFEKAIDEYDEAPKYAVLHLATSVELFLKSRLMTEHWALIFSEKSPPNLKKLHNGNFNSVTMGNAITKINGILLNELNISTDAKKEFNGLAKERNKIVHFFHPKLNDEKQREDIISQQCRVWYHMHHLLVNVWNEEYTSFEKKLSALSKKMQKQRQFLKEKFKIIKPELEISKKQGFSILDCDVCGFKSLVLNEDHKLLNSAICKVCHNNYRELKKEINIKCPACNEECVVSADGYNSCLCGYSFSPDKLSILLDLFTLDWDYGNQSIYCPECEAGNVYPIDKGPDYVCLNCFELFNEISTCQQCNEYWAGGMKEYSFYFGCALCDGYSG